MTNGDKLYRQYLSGDDDGLVELIRAYKDPLTRFLCAYVRDEWIAEELTEEVFFRLAVKKPRYDGKAVFRTWLFAIGRNLAYDHLRRQKRQSPVPFADLDILPSLNTPDRTLEQKDMREKLYEALARLPLIQREALHLSYFAGLSGDGVARVMGKTRRQVENLLYRARKRLKAELVKGGFSYEDL